MHVIDTIISKFAVKGVILFIIDPVTWMVQKVIMDVSTFTEGVLVVLLTNKDGQEL